MGFRRIGDLPKAQPHFRSQESVSRDPNEPGPWFRAKFPGECSSCGGSFPEDELIRADGYGDWEAQHCCGE